MKPDRISMRRPGRRNSKGRRPRRTFIAVFLTPALLSFLVFFLYPVARTVLISFYKVKGIADAMSVWEFVGFGNYKYLIDSPLFRQSLVNIFKIWSIGGIITICFALLFAVILSTGVRFKAFWRSLIYLPNTVSAVAMALMWTQYVYSNQDFGLLRSVFRALGLNTLANIQWTGTQYLFTSMLIAYCFGSVGYFMLILLAGIERIPNELYEISRIEGAGIFVQFTKITLPLIRNVFRTCTVLWTVAALNFFVWAQVFSPFGHPNVITPVYYMYNIVFGATTSVVTPHVNVGTGAAVAVCLTILVLVSYAVLNWLVPEKKYEY